MIGTFIATVLGVSGLVYLNYPDRVAYPREFENGLERELGGPGAVRVRIGRNDVCLYGRDLTNTLLGTKGWR